MPIVDTPPIGNPITPAPTAPKRREAIPALPQTGISQTDVDIYDQETALGLAQIAATFGASGGGANNANAMEALRNQLKFGLAGQALDREQLGLAREGVGLNRDELALNRRDDLESVINNALQRGIYRSGIRVRNERRVNERADLAGQRIDLQEEGLDITGKRIDLSEEQLRARIDNALEGLKSSAANSRRNSQARQDAAVFDFLQSRRTALDLAVTEAGGVFQPTGSSIVRTPGMPF